MDRLRVTAVSAILLSSDLSYWFTSWAYFVDHSVLGLTLSNFCPDYDHLFLRYPNRLVTPWTEVTAQFETSNDRVCSRRTGREKLTSGSKLERSESDSGLKSISPADGETTVQELRRIVTKFRDERDWRKFDTPRNLAVSITIEAAEVLEHFQWKTDEEIAKMLQTRDEITEISNELADVMIYCLGLSDILKVDVSSAIRGKLRENAEKYPALKRCTVSAE
jgi:dCTP diphosphatase